MDAWITVENARVRAALQQLIDDVTVHTAPTLGAIARLGENSTRMRFRTQIGPDGQRWKPSLRAQLTGGRTLTQDGHLSGSISSGYGRDFAEWGVNRVYARIQQEGGEIRPVSGKALRFRLANGAFVTARKVTIPARPYLGVSDDDADDILNILERRIRGAGDAAH